MPDPAPDTTPGNDGINLDVSYAHVDALPPGREKAIQYVVSGLLVAGSHHKQWCLARALEALGMSLDEARAKLPDYRIEDGIAP